MKNPAPPVLVQFRSVLPPSLPRYGWTCHNSSPRNPYHLPNQAPLPLPLLLAFPLPTPFKKAAACLYVYVDTYVISQINKRAGHKSLQPHPLSSYQVTALQDCTSKKTKERGKKKGKRKKGSKCKWGKKKAWWLGLNATRHLLSSSLLACSSSPLLLLLLLTPPPLCLACSPRSMYLVLCLLSKKKFHDIRLLNSFVPPACSFACSAFFLTSPRLDHHLA